MDGVITNFNKAKINHPLSNKSPFKGRPDLIPNIYKNLEPIENSIESVEKLINNQKFNVFFLSTPPWDNPDAWKHKRLWIEKYFGKKARHKLILSARKDLILGDFLIDDSKYRGQPMFKGKWIHFNTKEFPNWTSVLNFLESIT